MKPSFLILIFLFFKLSAAGQTLEQLENRLEQTKTDTARSTVCSQLVIVYSAKQMSKEASVYAEKTLSYAMKSQNELYIARAYCTMGSLFKSMHNTELAAANYKKSLFLFEKITNSREILHVKLEIAKCWSDLSKYKSSASVLDEILPQYIVLKDSIHAEITLVELAKNFLRMSKLQEAEEKYNQALSFTNFKRNPIEILNINRELANIYRMKGKYSQSLETYLGCLQMADQLHDKNQKGNIFYDIALLYNELEESFKAIKYLQEAEKMKTAVGDSYFLSQIYNEMGEIYLEKKDYSKALMYLKVSIDRAAEINNLESTTSAHYKIAEIYLAQKESNYVLPYLQKALGLAIKTKDAKSEMEIYSLDGLFYEQSSNNELAIFHYKKSYLIATGKGFPESAKKTAEKLSKLLHQSNKLEEAFKYLNIANSLSDSVNGIITHKKIMRLQAVYEFERRARSKQFEKEKKEDELLANFKLEKQQKEYILVAFVFLFAIFLILYRAYREKKKGNKILAERNYEIEVQSEEINSKNRRITDSIYYAKRIQKAALTPTEQLDKFFGPNFFTLFKPKDIVSGDFYLAKQKGDLTFLAVADCTGHGVPGAFMSMMGISLLNEVLNHPDVNDPAVALSMLRDKVIDALHQKTGIGGFKDGMNISMCTINSETHEMLFSGSYHPIYIIRDGELFEFRGDRIPISIYTKTKDAFSYHRFQLQSNDMVYLYTDGFVDQIGGPQNKKFYPKPFKKLLQDISAQPMEQQRDCLDETIEKWRGSEEQIDDILVLGVKIQ